MAAAACRRPSHGLMARQAAIQITKPIDENVLVNAFDGCLRAVAMAKIINENILVNVFDARPTPAVDCRLEESNRLTVDRYCRL